MFIKTSITFLVAFFAIATFPQEQEKQQSSEHLGTEKELRQLLDVIARDLSQKGPLGWLENFSKDESFFMASDGKVVFSDFNHAESFLKGFATKVEKMELEWSQVEIQILHDRFALVAAEYEESISEKSGKVQEFGGYFSGLAVRETSDWRLRHLHWSSPKPESN